jgi:hypothetical protein
VKNLTICKYVKRALKYADTLLVTEHIKNIEEINHAFHRKKKLVPIYFK